MRDRRDFLKTFLAASVAITSSVTIADTLISHDASNALKPLKPKRLAKGQTIGLIAPSSNVGENEDIFYAREVLESCGF
jgi:hypothetical protein